MSVHLTNQASANFPQLSNNALSVLSQKWVIEPVTERLILTFSQKFRISELLARILLYRGATLEDAHDYLNPTLRSLLPDPSCLLDMDEGIERTIKALDDQEKITIYGDYDVDGATSTALLRRYLRDIGFHVELYIPDRLQEGYGANTEALLALRGSGATLVIMTDCGTTAFDPIQKAKEAGLDIIVIDHHLAEVRLPPAIAIINPNRLDQPKDNNLSHLCAAGVAFLFLVALQRELRRRGFFKEKTEPDLKNYLDIVALGTVCDVMPLTGLNRAFVTQGLKVMHQGVNLGMTVLSEVAELNERAKAHHFGFLLGPRINAGGRVGEATLGSHLLYTESLFEAKTIALKLNNYNKERQQIEKDVLESARRKVEEEKLYDKALIMVGGDDWHPGVIGIVASRLKDLYQKPVCVVGYIGDEGKGSGRSVPGLHLGDAMHKAVREGFLAKGGGHSMAAGFTVMRSYFAPFYMYLDELFSPLMKARESILKVDGALSLTSVTTYLIDELETLEPYGVGNPTPRFMFEGLYIKKLTIVGGDHLSCIMEDRYQSSLKMMLFRSGQSAIAPLLMEASRAKVKIDIVGTLKKNTWQGRTECQVFIEDGRYYADTQSR